MWSTTSAGPSVLLSDSRFPSLAFPSWCSTVNTFFLFLISSNYWPQLLYLTLSPETITISRKLPWSLTTNPQISCKNIHLWLLPCLIVLPRQHLAFYFHSGSYSFLPPRRPHVTDYPFFLFILNLYSLLAPSHQHLMMFKTLSLFKELFLLPLYRFLHLTPQSLCSTVRHLQRIVLTYCLHSPTSYQSSALWNLGFLSPTLLRSSWPGQQCSWLINPIQCFCYSLSLHFANHFLLEIYQWPWRIDKYIGEF